MNFQVDKATDSEEGTTTLPMSIVRLLELLLVLSLERIALDEIVFLVQGSNFNYFDGSYDVKLKSQWLG